MCVPYIFKTYKCIHRLLYFNLHFNVYRFIISVADSTEYFTHIWTIYEAKRNGRIYTLRIYRKLDKFVIATIPYLLKKHFQIKQLNHLLKDNLNKGHSVLKGKVVFYDLAKKKIIEPTISIFSLTCNQHDDELTAS